MPSTANEPSPVTFLTIALFHAMRMWWYRKGQNAFAACARLAAPAVLLCL